VSAEELAIDCRGLRAGYGTTVVVRDIDLSVARREIVVLLGPNGAGKTTTLLTIAGQLPKLGGEAIVESQPVSSDRPHHMIRRGFAFVPDNRGLVTGLTVHENLRLGQRKQGEDLEHVLDVFPSLHKRLHVKAGSLSGGEQQMLAVGRALLGRPRTLVIDEMSLGLSPTVVESLFLSLRRIVAEFGSSVLLVEQHIELALRNADRAYVMVHGEIVLHRDAATLSGDNDLLMSAYLGELKAQM
jgi:branched-chain amino acid transport system ATP-binding protein